MCLVFIDPPTESEEFMAILVERMAASDHHSTFYNSIKAATIALWGRRFDGQIAMELARLRAGKKFIVELFMRPLKRSGSWNKTIKSQTIDFHRRTIERNLIESFIRCINRN